MNDGDPKVLILTPIKDAARHLNRYVELVEALDWPGDRLSIGFLEGDSQDGTYALAQTLLPRLRQRCARAELFRRDFGFTMPPGTPRWAPAFQLLRRTVLARARNHLLFRMLENEDWVLWLDVDIVGYPPDVLRRLIGSGFMIVVPNCVTCSGGPTFDRNNWAAQGAVTLSDRRGTGPMRLDSVGGTMLLVQADLHRDGLIFPSYRYGLESRTIRAQHPVWGRGEIETEGLAAMAADMGVQCWGLPDLEIVHAEV